MASVQKTSSKYEQVPPPTVRERAMYREVDMVVVGSLRSGFSVHSEPIQAGVVRVTPVRQHSHLNDLEGLVVWLLNKNGNCLPYDCKPLHLNYF